MEIMSVAILGGPGGVMADIDHIAETVIVGALADNFIVPGVFDTAPSEWSPGKDSA
jgi:hypothetical protein